MINNIQKYKALLTCVEYGSITRASQVLNYSQSGISRMIADLEKEWDITLLERNREGVQLTSDGLTLLPYIRSLCHEHEKLNEQVYEIKNISSGIVRIGCFSSVASFWLPKIIQEFHDDYPKINYELVHGDYIEIENWIAEGRVDCGFVRLPVANKQLQTRFLAKDDLMIVIPENHPLASMETIPISEIENYPFLMLETDNNDYIRKWLNEQDINPNICLTTWDDFAIMNLVERGFGISILPKLILQKTSYRLITKPLNIPIYREIGIAVRDWETLSLASKKFVDRIRW